MIHRHNPCVTEAVAFLGASGKSRSQAGTGRSSPCSLLQSLAPSFMLLPPWLLCLLFPLCSAKRGCRLGSSQGTRVAGPCSEKSDGGSLPTTHSCPVPSLAAPFPFLPRDSGDKGSPCFSLILYALYIFFFLHISFSLFFLPTFFFFLLLKLPKASQGPPRLLQPQSILLRAAPCSLVHPSPFSF